MDISGSSFPYSNLAPSSAPKSVEPPQEPILDPDRDPVVDPGRRPIRPPEEETPPQGVNLSIAPNEGNQSSGDRSQNSYTVTLTTPTNEFESQFTREQVVNAAAYRSVQNSLEQALPSSGSNVSPAAALYIKENGEEGDLASVAVAANQVKLADAYLSASQAAQPQSENEPQQANSTPVSSSEAAQFYKDVNQKQVKQELFFSVFS